MEVENVTLGRHIDRLEEAGWVERRRDPADRRAWRLYLDEKARPIIDRLSVLSRGVREEALAGIPPDECEHLIDTLIHIKDKLLPKETAVGEDRKTVVSGKSVSVSVGLGGRRLKKK